MEQLNFCFGSTLGTGDVLFRLTAGRVCLKNLYKGDFMGVCNSFITERSLGYARQNMATYVPCVVGASDWHLAVLLFTMWDILYKCTVHISLYYTVTAVHWCNYDHLFHFANLVNFNTDLEPTEHLYNTSHCTESKGNYSSEDKSVIFGLRWDIVLFSLLFSVSLYLSVLKHTHSVLSSIFGYRHSRTYSEHKVV